MKVGFRGGKGYLSSLRDKSEGRAVSGVSMKVLERGRGLDIGLRDRLYSISFLDNGLGVVI
jgi:hypothetical protein